MLIRSNWKQYSGLSIFWQKKSMILRDCLLFDMDFTLGLFNNDFNVWYYNDKAIIIIKYAFLINISKSNPSNNYALLLTAI